MFIEYLRLEGTDEDRDAGLELLGEKALVQAMQRARTGKPNPREALPMPYSHCYRFLFQDLLRDDGVSPALTSRPCFPFLLHHLLTHLRLLSPESGSTLPK